MDNLEFFEGKEIECPICKKIFIRLSSNWVYKIGSGTHQKYFCSWKCMRKAEKDFN